jgi:hypothetical protein
MWPNVPMHTEVRPNSGRHNESNPTFHVIQMTLVRHQSGAV